MKTIIRSNIFISIIRLFPISILTFFAKKISNTKIKFGKNNILNKKYKDELKKFAFNKMNTENIDALLMGHYHQLGIENKNHQHFIHLGDWINHYTVTIFDNQ